MARTAAATCRKRDIDTNCFRRWWNFHYLDDNKESHENLENCQKTLAVCLGAIAACETGEKILKRWIKIVEKKVNSSKNVQIFQKSIKYSRFFWKKNTNLKILAYDSNKDSSRKRDIRRVSNPFENFLKNFRDVNIFFPNFIQLRVNIIQNFLNFICDQIRLNSLNFKRN